MKSKIALEKIFEKSLSSCKNDVERKEMDIFFKQVLTDLEILDQFKGALVFQQFDEPDFDLDEPFTVEKLMRNVRIGYRRMVDEAYKQAFTKWIIDNFDKETIERWLENEKSS